MRHQWTLVFAIVEICLFLQVTKGNSIYPNSPKVMVNGYTTNGYYGGTINSGRPKLNFTFQNPEGTLFIVPSTVGQLVLECNASYPLIWNLVESDINPEIFPFIRIHTKREVGDLFDPTTFNYTSTLVLSYPGDSHKFTGNYSCQHTGKRDIKTNVFIYWEASGLEFLIHSKEQIVKYIENGKVMLPCGVSSPKLSRPKLWKQFPIGKGKFRDELLKVNKSISYSPNMGFLLDQVPDPFGKYKCTMNEQSESEDAVIITVKNATIPLKKSNATFTYNSNTNTVVCCSSSKRAPNIFIMHCGHAVSCQFREHVLEPYHYIFSRASKKGNCARKKVHFYHTVLIRCLGDGIDEYKEMITPVNTVYMPWNNNKSATFKTFFRWEEIDSQDMLALQYSDIGQSSTPDDKSINAFYDKQTVSVHCITSSYYFSEGNYWAIRWKNKTLTPVHEKTTDPTGIVSYPLQTGSLSYKIDTAMEAFVCFAPVWNSSVWVLKTGFLYVNETVVPILIQNDTLEYTWYTNETSKDIICEGKGTPDPLIIWSHNHTEIGSNTHNYNITTTRQNDTGVIKSTLKIIRISQPAKGQYICTVSNYGGIKTRIFNVNVLETTSWKTTTVVVISTGIICILLAATGFLWRKTRADQKAIQHLASVHFKDPISRDQAVGADDTNMTNDAGKITNQLIS